MNAVLLLRLFSCAVVVVASQEESSETCEDNQVSLLQTQIQVQKHNASWWWPFGNGTMKRLLKKGKKLKKKGKWKDTGIIPSYNISFPIPKIRQAIGLSRPPDPPPKWACRVKGLSPTIINDIEEREKTWKHNSFLRVTLRSAVDLKPSDKAMFGFGVRPSDPYCDIEFMVCSGCPGNKDDVKAQTPYIKGTNNPTWKFHYTTPDWSEGDKVLFTCYDRDRFSKDDYLGKAELIIKRPTTKDEAKYRLYLDTQGYLNVELKWRDCEKECSATSVTMAKLADYVYKFGAQADNYHLIRQAELGSRESDPLLTTKDRMALYKKKGSEDCVLAFSGTNDERDWFQNLNFVHKSACGYTMHAGFMGEVENYFQSCEMATFSKIIHHFCKSEAKLVGHSLGGAVATIAAGCLNSPHGVRGIAGAHQDILPFRAAALYTIGAPAASAESITDSNGTCFKGIRSYNVNSKKFDIVPWLSKLCTYRHPKLRTYELYMADNRKDKKVSKKIYKCNSEEAAVEPKKVSRGRQPGTVGHERGEYVLRLMDTSEKY